MADLTIEEAQSKDLSYPEGGWIGVCANYFPSEVQWLYKGFSKAQKNSTKTVPDYSTTSFTSQIGEDLVTLGTGKTTNLIPIHEQVGLDWIRYAIQKRFWGLLYKNEKINSTVEGLQLFFNELVYVLDIAVKGGILSQYEITSQTLDRNNNKVSFTFRAQLEHTIFSASVTGNLYN